jgi:hypothetical protein
MTKKTYLIFLFLMSLISIDFQSGIDNGMLVLINNSDKPFHYTFEVSDEMTNRIYVINPDSTDYPFLNISESDTLNLGGQYSEGDQVSIYIYVKQPSKNNAERVRTETIGIKFLNDTKWAPIVIENL